MGSIALLAAFLACGLLLCDGLFRRESGIVRLWLGLCAGLMLLMWLPALCAYPLGFTRAAQWTALALSALLAGGVQLACRGVRRPAGFFGDVPPALLLGLVIPFALFSGYLQFTHTLREVGGTLHVGQSTYGDLCLHLGIATSTQNAAFPPDYSILKGTLLGYPFLADSMVSSLLLFGGGLAESFVVTGTLMMALVYTGFVLFAWELTRSRLSVVIAFLLMFANGGLGFLYTFDGVMKDSTALREVFTGFYKTPTNQPDLNLRWVNVIADMMVPQRTLLTGWMVLLPALFQLLRCSRQTSLRPWLVLGVWAGAMPLIHTHSFLALGLISLGAMLYAPFHGPKEAGDARAWRISSLKGFVAYGVLAVLLALPQLLTWSMPQTLGGGSLRLRFNWVNNRGDGRLIDGYFWFWIKNVGLAYLLMVPAARHAPRGGKRRMLALGALLVYVTAELVQFQPNEYDNNKLFYVAYMAMLPAVGDYMAALWRALKGMPGRGLLAALTAFVCLISGSLSLAREAVSDYELFGSAEVQAADWIRENAGEKAMFLTGQQHNNAVAALTGRYIVCGTGSYLYFHGLDYGRQQQDALNMLEAPGENAALFDKYDVEYAYLSWHEKNSCPVDEAWYRENWELVFEMDGVEIYRRP